MPTGRREEPDAVVSGGLRRLVTAFAENARLALVGVIMVVLILAFCYLGPLVYHTEQVQTISP